MEGFRKIITYANDYKKKTYLALCLIFVSVILGVIPYVITYNLITKFLVTKDITGMYIIVSALLIALALIFKGVFYYKGLEASHEAAFDTLMGMRIRFAHKMMKQPLGNIVNKGSGSFKKNIVDDIDSIESLLAHMIPEGLPYALVPIIVFIILFIIDIRVGLLSLGSLPFGIAAMAIMFKKSMEKMDDYYRSAEEMNSTIVEYVEGMEVIKIFGRTTDSYEKYSTSIENYKVLTLNWFKESWTWMSIYGSVLPCTVILLLPIGTYMYMNGTLELSKLVFSLLLSMSLGTPLLKMIDFIPIIPQLSFKINELEKTFESEELMTGDEELSGKSYEIEFDHVTFAYDEKEVIKDVSFVIKSGGVTAIVGESGSGKSTLAKLLVHYWDVKSGAITIGGTNINHVPVEKLMDHISYVDQDTFLFNISIMENIRLGNPEASDEEVMMAAKAAMCHDFIMAMDKGYDTRPGDYGDKLSGGEKQRITIARAILKNAPIVILDEATAFADSENEDKIQNAISRLTAGKIVIVVAHRLSTIVDANKIIVMKEGQVIGQGTHEKLLEGNEEYKKLWKAHRQSTNWHLNIKEENYA